MNWLLQQRNHFLENWYNQNGTLFFLVLCFLYIVLFLLKRMLIIDSIAAFEVLQERGEMWVFDLFFGLQYLSVPIFLAWKFTLTAFLIWVGCFMFGYRLTFNQLWKMVMIFEIIFVVGELVKIIWFLLLGGDPDYHEYMAFYPLSIMSLFDSQSLPDQFHYPFKALNLFELIYWVSLILGVYWLSGKKLIISTYVILSSYILIFCMWLVFFVVVYK